MNLHIITACVRPDNLPLLEQNIVKNINNIKVIWHIVYDLRKIKLNTSFTSDKIHLEKYFFKGKPGHSPINQVFDKLQSLDNSNFFYILDDDNILHSELEKNILSLAGRSFCLVMGQILAPGVARQASFANIKPSCVDTGQFVMTADLIGNNRWDTYQKDKTFFPDGNFLVQALLEHREKFVIINKPLTYYNGLI